MSKKPKTSNAKRNWRTIYFKDITLWDKVVEVAKQQDRSVNYVIEKLVKTSSGTGKWGF